MSDFEIQQKENDFKDKVIAALFDGVITQAFPKMGFVKKGGKWVSNCHLDGATDTQGKEITFVYSNAPFNVKDVARDENKGIIDLYMTQNGLSYAEARVKLSELTRVPLPDNSTGTDEGLPQQTSRRMAAEAFKAALWSGSDNAERALDYLRNSRGYSDDLIKRMGIGLIDRGTQSRLEGSAKQECYFFGKDVEASIAIPFAVGSFLAGFKFRSVTGEKQYINSKGLRKGAAFFGIKNGMDTVIVVESELDALHAKAEGMENVVASSGGATTAEQIADARRRGVKNFVLLFDNDSRGAIFTENSIRLINDDRSVKVASLPIDYKDLDEYLKENSVGALRRQIDKARPAAVWGYDNFVAESQMEGFEQYSQMKEAERARQQQAKDTAEQALSLIEQGRTNEAIVLMKDSSKQLNVSSDEDEFRQLYTPPTEGDYYSALSQTNKGLPTGIVFGNIGGRQEHLTLNAGLTFVCGSTGHGKTSILNNIALNEAERNIKLNTGSKVLYYSYEIYKEQLTLDLVNTYANLPGISPKPYNSIEYYFTHRNSSDRFHFFKGRANNPYCSEFERKEKAFYNNFIKSGALTLAAKKYTVEKLVNAMTYAVERDNVSLICIDYAQLIYSAIAHRQRTEEIKKVVNDLKDFANDYKLPILLAAQFNREVFSPISLSSSNIGEGGDLERIADTVIGIFNLERIEPLAVSKKREETDAAVKLLQKHIQIGQFEPVNGKMYLRLLKRRYGISNLDTVLDWNGSTKKITLNKPEALEADATQAALWNMDGEEEQIF